MRVRWTQPAAGDLTAICDYLEYHESPALARRVAQAVYSAVQSLSPFPAKGRRGRLPETRELLIQRYPYIVI
jgi:plasmid stabilization system protein ParE